MEKKTYTIAMVVASPFPANHGTPGSIREMSQALTSLGHRVHIVTYPMGQDIPAEGLTVHRVGRLFRNRKITVGPTWYKPLLDFLLALKVCTVVRKEKVDVIHAHNYEGALAGYIAKLCTGTPMIYNAVNNMIDELPSYGSIKWKAFARSLARCLDNTVPRMGDHVIPISEELYNFLRGKNIPAEKMTFVPLGVNTKMFEGKSPDIMRKRYAINGRPLVVYTGTLDRFQRIDYLLKAMGVVTKEIKEAVLMLVGNIIDPSDLQRVSTMTQDLGLENNVVITDQRPLEELPYFLASADVAVIPRTSCPGFPVKLLNYMAAGKAIVAFEGSAKGLRDMTDALVIKNDEWEAFGKGILRLLQDRQLADALGQQARQRVCENFDWIALTKKLEDIYAGVLARAQGVPSEAGRSGGK